MADNQIIQYINNIRLGEIQDNPPIYIIMNWLYYCDNELQILLLNELINTNVFKLTKHNILLQQLLKQCIVTTKLTWPKKHKNSDKLNIVSQYFKLSKREVKGIINLFNDEDIEQMQLELNGKF